LQKNGAGNATPRLTHQVADGEVCLHATSVQTDLTVTAPLRPQEFL
jgi:hypothetical protein